MSNTPIAVTRDQLAEFLPNQRMIRAFEQLIQQTGVMIPADIVALQQYIQEVNIAAGTGEVKAQAALDMLVKIEQLLAVLVSAPSVIPYTPPARAIIAQSSPEIMYDNVVRPDYVDFYTTAPTPVKRQGRLHWGASSTLHFDMTTTIDQPVGEALYIYVKASSTITKGQLVMHSGAVSASGVISAAPTSTGLLTPSEVIGVAAEDIALNDFGLIMREGFLDGLDTSGTPVGEVWASNDKIWYHPTSAGNMTNVQPVAPNQKTRIAEVITAASGTGGSIQIRIQQGTQVGYADSNVQITAVANLNLLQYDSGLGYWKNVAATSIQAGSVQNALTNGSFLTSTGTYDGSVARTFAVDATSVNTASKVVSRDASGNFAAGSVTVSQLLAITANTTGYSTGAGGTVTQATNKTTAVTLNKPTGRITTNNAALAAATTVSFTWNNSLMGAADTVILSLASTGIGTNYNWWITDVAAGSCIINLRNISAGSRSEALVFNVCVIRGATS